MLKLIDLKGSELLPKPRTECLYKDKNIAWNAAVSALEDLGVEISVENLCTMLCFKLGEIGGASIYENYPHKFNEVMPKISQALCDSAGSWLRIVRVK